MSTEAPDRKPNRSSAESEFAKEAEKETVGLVQEFGTYLLQNKKWWLMPVIAALLLVGVLIVLGGTALAPFIYPIF